LQRTKRIIGGCLILFLCICLITIGIFALTQPLEAYMHYNAVLAILAGSCATIPVLTLILRPNMTKDSFDIKTTTDESFMSNQLDTLATSDTQERIHQAQNWCEGLKLVHDHCKGEERRESDMMIDYINRFASFGIPTVNEGVREITFISNQIQTIGFYLVPLLGSDANLHPYFAETMELPYYDEITRAIFLPPSKISPIWKGAMLHRELYRTIVYRANHHRYKKMRYWIQEYEIHLSQAKILKQLFPRHFDSEINRIAEQFKPYVRTGNLAHIDPKIITPAILDKLFKQSLSPAETKYQYSFVFLEALHRAVDLAFTSKRKRNKEHVHVTFWAYDPESFQKKV
jgi:hypothetical protein